MAQTERPISSFPAPAGAPASLPSPATRTTSLFPGLYLQTLHSSHGHCQHLRLPRCSCHCSPLAHLSFTASGSCRHHHPPLNSSKFLPGHAQTAAATATARLPTDTRSVSCPREEPCPRARPQQIHPAAPRLPPPPRGTCPLHQHQHIGELPKKHDQQSTAIAKGPLRSSRKVTRQCYQPSVKRYALRHRS